MIIDRVRRTIDKYCMLSHGERVIVGVSGGMDSVALLSILDKLREVYGISIVVAHLNHNLRGQESHRDAEFVKKLTLKMGIPFEIESVAVREKRKGMTLQEAAREERFLFFHRLVQHRGAQKVALGQTADDQAETILMRFLRGAGLMGLKGIPPVRDGLIIHPLVEVTRKEIESYLDAEGLPHVEDSSNLKDLYLRNRIRRHLIPRLEEYNPNLKTGLVRMGQVLYHEDQFLNEKAQEIWDKIVRQDDDAVSLDLNEFRKINPALEFRLLRKSVESVSAVSAKRLSTTHILSLVDMALGPKPNAIVRLPGGVTAKRVYDRFEIGKKTARPLGNFDLALFFPGVTPIKELGKKLVISFENQWDWNDTSPYRVVMDRDRLKSPYRVRNTLHGDRFRPLGMTGRKKVKDCFIDWKIPLEERPRVPLVVSGDEIVWVVGYRISEKVRITPRTKGAVRMEIQTL
ncbi:MAG: tRNA lysidine(34) synthetase TilS [Proteobacteria bacterium]|nr:tRNA lysidine(34) synthetase TilS [Pseudomonadota bacterium]